MPKFTRTKTAQVDLTRVTIWLPRAEYKRLSKLAKIRKTSRTKVVVALIANAQEVAGPIPSQASARIISMSPLY